MTKYRVELYCDELGCLAESGASHARFISLPLLEKNLIETCKGKGWIEVNGKHYCPKHAKGDSETLRI